MRVEPYLFFEGRCEEAIEFYKEQLDAQVAMLMRYKDNPQLPAKDCGMPPGMENKVMHASLKIGETTVSVSDGRCDRAMSFQGFALTLPVASDAEAHQRFEALASGGKVTMPLGKTFFSSCFGMVADRFGVMWIVIVQA